MSLKNYLANQFEVFCTSLLNILKIITIATARHYDYFVHIYNNGGVS